MAHEHNHSHTPTNFNRAFAIGIVLNLAFVMIEAAYGTISNSLALIADAGHNLSDVMTLLLAWGGRWPWPIGRQKPRTLLASKRELFFRPLPALFFYVWRLG
ncbi:MAG: cation transporter [Desulfopila sp.]